MPELVFLLLLLPLPPRVPPASPTTASQPNTLRYIGAEPTTVDAKISRLPGARNESAVGERTTGKEWSPGPGHRTRGRVGPGLTLGPRPGARARLRWLICEVLRPRALHIAAPCTDWCVIGRRSPGAGAKALLRLKADCLLHQERNGLLANQEGPAGNLLPLQPLWKERFGPPEQPRQGWGRTGSDACMYGLLQPWPGRGRPWLGQTLRSVVALASARSAAERASAVSSRALASAAVAERRLLPAPHARGGRSAVRSGWRPG